MKSAWFIDGAYLFREAPFDFDLARLRERVELRLGGAFHDCYYFQATREPHLDIRNHFYESLQTARPDGAQIRVWLERAVQVTDDTDPSAAAALVTQLMLAGFELRYEQIVISAGHARYADALSYLRDKLELSIVLAVFEDSVEPRLQSVVDEVLWLNELWDDLD
jgi:hypothetical protein